jgi:recombination protein RecT
MANITVSKQVKEYLTNPKLGLTERIQGAMTPQKAEIFKTSLLNTVNSTTLWEKVNPLSIIQSALISTTLDLPINQNLGFAYLIPYGSNAQFQIGYKGLIQLAQRTGQYQTISASEVREGQIVSYDPLKGIEFDWTISDGEIIGYVSYFRLVNGFEKYLYMSLKELEAHGAKYSKSYNSKDKYTKQYNGIWRTDFDAMAKKTVLKQLISKFGIMSVEMQDAVVKDQSVVNEEGETVFGDNPNIIIEEPKDTRSDLLKFIQDEVKTVEALEEVYSEVKTDEEREAYSNKLDELQGEIITEAI